MGAPDESDDLQAIADFDMSKSQDFALRIRAGDRRAFEALAELYYARCVRYAYRYVHDLVAAEDIVQDTLLHIWIKRETLKIQNSLISYLFGVVRNRALNYTRHQKVEARYESKFPATDTFTIEAHSAPIFEDEERSDDKAFEIYLSAVHAAVAELPERQGEAFSLRVEHGMTFAEVAEAMGISLRAAQTNYFRAVQHLRKRLQPDPGA